MDVVIKSRNKAHKDSYATIIPKTAIISIHTPGDSPNTFAEREDICEVLHLSFHDIGMRDRDGKQMTEDDAEKVASFVYECKRNNVEELWVHCDAGISRSAGVGAAILKYLTEDDSKIFNNPRYYPNMICYRLTLEALMKLEEEK